MRGQCEEVLRWFRCNMGSLNLLGAGEGGLVLGQDSATVLSIMPSLSALEALSFLHAFGSFNWGELRQGDCVHVHGIWIMVGARGGVGLENGSSFP